MIKTVQFSSNRNSEAKNNIEIAQPSKDKGSVTVICGKNHSGKTFIVTRMQKCIFKRNETIKQNPDCETLRFEANRVYTEFSKSINIIESVYIQRIAKITDLIQGLSIIANNSHLKSQELKKPDRYSQIQIKQGLEIFFHECIAGYLNKLNIKLNKDDWFDKDKIDYRKKILNEIDEKWIYLTSRNNPIVEIFEKLTQGKLYFGITFPNSKEKGRIPVFELRLAFNEQNNISIGAWSEGQKVLFSLLIIVHYIKPQILIYDEIENHLHPEYISSLLEFIKENIQQTIITTHHPHVIFSKHVDVVNYLEFSKLIEGLPYKISRSKKDNTKPLKQSNSLLDKNYSKLISTYKLFDSYDNQLLRLSTLSLADLNDLLVEIFTSLFNNEIIEPQISKKPDLQSQKLYEIFEKRFHDGDLKILEFGAGTGRLLIDINKILRAPEKERITWYLFEPFEQARKQLIGNLENHPYKSFINICSEKPVEYFDFIVIPNVLHELPANTIAGILSYCSTSLRKNGSIIIVELFPLLKSEKYAVPLSSSEWTNLARKLGFKAINRGINFRNAVHEAYFVQLFLPNQNFNFEKNKMEKVIKDFWLEEILIERIHSYDGQLRLNDVDDIPITLGNICTVVSILSYKNDIWKT